MADPAVPEHRAAHSASPQTTITGATGARYPAVAKAAAPTAAPARKPSGNGRPPRSCRRRISRRSAISADALPRHNRAQARLAQLPQPNIEATTTGVDFGHSKRLPAANVAAKPAEAAF